MLANFLKELGLSPEESAIYMALMESGGSTAGDIAKRYPMPRATLYGFLQRMTDKGLINRTLRKGIRYFTPASPEKIDLLLREKLSVAQKNYADFQKILPNLMAQKGGYIVNPKIKIFEGEAEVRNILGDMLNYNDIETCSYWPIKSMVKHLGEDFFYHHNKIRIKSNLYTRAIWPAKEVLDIANHPYLGFGAEFKREIRIAPNEIDFVMGYWMYDNKVAFLSSKVESYGFLIESLEMVEMIKSQFEIIWSLSKPLEKLPDASLKYLIEIDKGK